MKRLILGICSLLSACAPSYDEEQKARTYCNHRNSTSEWIGSSQFICRPLQRGDTLVPPESLEIK